MQGRRGLGPSRQQDLDEAGDRTGGGGSQEAQSQDGSQAETDGAGERVDRRSQRDDRQARWTPHCRQEGGEIRRARRVHLRRRDGGRASCSN